MRARRWMLAIGVVALVCAHVLMRTFALQMARVEGMAMAPAIVDQDRVVVNKLAYRYTDPRAGDIVMLRYPSRHWGFVPRKYIVGRVASRWWPMGTARKF